MAIFEIMDLVVLTYLFSLYAAFKVLRLNGQLQKRLTYAYLKNSKDFII